MAGVFAGLSAVTGSGSNNNETTTTASSAAPWPLRAPAVTTAQPHTPPVVLFGAAGANASTFASAFGSSNSSSSGHSSSATTSAPTRPALFATSPAMTTTPSAPPPPLFGNTAAVRSTPFSFATPRATTRAAAMSKPPATMTTPAATPFTSSASVFGAPSAFAALTTATTAPFAFGARNNNNNSNISAAHTPSTSNTSVSQSLSTTSTFGIRPQRDDGVLASNNNSNNNNAIAATMRKAPRRDDEDSHDAQQRGRASHGAFVARAVSAANTPQQATSSLRRPTTTTTAAAAAATAPQLAAAASLSPRVAVPESTAQMCLLARVVDSFYRKLAAPSAAVREQAGHEVSLALCGVAGRVGVYADVTRTAAELHAVWTRARAQHHSSDNSSSNSSSSRAGLQRCRGDVWVVVFTLGAQINLMVHAAQEHNTTSSSDNNNKSTGSSTTATYSDAQLAAYKAAVHTHRRAALADACALANELSTLLLDVYSHDDDTRAPFSALAPVLRCVQAAFDAAAAAGVTRVQSNLKAVTSKLFSVLYKRVKGHVVRQAGASSSSSHETWVLRTNNDSHDDEAAAVVTRALLCAFATLVSVMMRVEAPSNDDVDRFVDAFHRSLRDAYAERCVLYECRANVLLQHPLTMERVAQAAELFARAIVTSRLATTAATTATSGQRDVGDGGEGGERARRRLLHMKLTATQLALGRIPSSSSSSSSTKKDSNDGDADDDDDDGGGAVLPRELADVAVALRAANLTLFDAGMRHNAVFFVQAGLYNVLQLARVRVSLLMVVKAYMARGCDNRLLVSDLVALHALPYDEEEAALVWLLPLLVDKHINGVLDGGALILSDANPFDDYPKATLRAAAAAEYA